MLTSKTKVNNNISCQLRDTFAVSAHFSEDAANGDMCLAVYCQETLLTVWTVNIKYQNVVMIRSDTVSGSRLICIL